MTRAALFPVAAMLERIAAAKRMLVCHLARGFRSELIGKEHPVRIENRVLIIRALFQKPHHQRTGAVMQRGKVHVDNHRFAGFYGMTDIFSNDFFYKCLSHNEFLSYYFPPAISDASRQLTSFSVSNPEICCKICAICASV